MTKEYLIKKAKSLKSEEIDVSLFSNKYYHEPSSTYNKDFFNHSETILILDYSINKTEKQKLNVPYINVIPKKNLKFFMEYFPNFPVHKTNRIPLSGYIYDNKFENLTADILIFKPVFDELINFIKPKILITFSNFVGEYFETKYQIQLCNIFQDKKNIWKGFIKIGKYYYYIYCIPGLEKLKINEEPFFNFIMSSTVFDFKTSSHLNYLISRNINAKIPKDPLKNRNVRNNLRNGSIVSSFSLQHVSPKGLQELISDIQKFDVYDLIIQNELFFDPSRKKYNLTCKKYNELRKSKSSKLIYYEYIDPHRIDYKLQIINLIMIQYYLYTKYPEESFEYDWKDIMVGVSNDSSNMFVPKEVVITDYNEMKKRFVK